MTTKMAIIVDPMAVNEYLFENHLTMGYAPIEAFLVQSASDLEHGRAVLITVRLPNGNLVLAKTTLKLMTAAVMAAGVNVP